MFWNEPAYAAFWLGVARTDLATWLQLTPYAYAALEGVHLVGIAFFFGAVFLLDLRLLGLMPGLTAPATERFLLRIAIPAFVLVASSGALLFVPSADRYASSPAFLLKLVAIAVGGLNALAFHRRSWGATARTARAAALVSVAVWVAAIALGRSMGYERRDPPPGDLEALPWLGTALETQLPERPLGAAADRPRLGDRISIIPKPRVG